MGVLKSKKRCVFLFLFLLAVAGMVGVRLLAQEAGSPLITDAYVQPSKVRPGEIMLVVSLIEDDYGIASVSAEMPYENGADIIDLELSAGTNLKGTYQGRWKVHDTKAKEYITTITATNIKGKSSSVEIAWFDPPTWWNTNYAYRKQITINNNSTTDTLPGDLTNTGYTVNPGFNFAGEVDAGKALVSGDDVRVVWWDSTNNNELDRILTPAFALEFDGLEDGSGDYVQVPDSATLRPASTISISAWVYPTASKAQTIVDLYDRKDDGTETGFYYLNGAYLSLTVSDTVAFVIGNGASLNTSVTLTSSGTVTQNAWNHIVAVSDGTSNGTKIYISSSTPDSNTATAALNYAATTYEYNIGRRYDYDDGLPSPAVAFDGEYFSGTIDEVAVFSDVLTPTEIGYLYNSGSPQPLELTSLNGDADLVGLWHFDEGTGEGAKDSSDKGSSGNDDDGLLGAGNGANMSAWTDTAKVAPRSKYSLGMSFDGVDDSVEATSGLNGVGTFSMAVWIKPTVGDLSQGFIFSPGSTAMQTWVINGNIQFLLGGNYADGSISYGVWSHIVFVADSGGHYTYINGALAGSNTGTATLNSNNLTIGDYYTGGFEFNGNIDEVAVYSGALDTSEITALYNSGKGARAETVDTSTSGSVLKGLWHLNGDAIDSSGQGNDGTIKGARTSYGKVLEQTTPLWFKLQANIAASGSSPDYYIYYGNSGAGDPAPVTANVFQKLDSTDTDLRALWRMDDGVSPTDDYSANANTGAIYSVTSASAVDESFTSAFDTAVQLQHKELSGSPVVTTIGGGTTYTETTDYTINYSAGQITVLSGAGMADATAYEIDYTYDNSGAAWAGSDGGQVDGMNKQFASGDALTFDGTDDYVSVTDDATLDFDPTADSFTLTAWIKSSADNTAPAPTDQLIINKKQGSGNPGYKMLLKDKTNGGALSVVIEDSEATPNVVTLTGIRDLIDNNRHHLAAVYDASADLLTLYVDAESEATASYVPTATATNARDLFIGSGDLGADYFFNGTIDEAAIYDRALSGAEIKAFYERRKYLSPAPGRSTETGTAPAVTSGAISHSGATGTGSGATQYYISGNTITLVWDNSATGDNNAGISGVTADFSTLGGGSFVTMYDDGTNGDTTASDNKYTAQYSIPNGYSNGSYSLSVTASISGGSGYAGISVNVDTQISAPTLTNPAVSSSDDATITVDFNLAEAGADTSVKLTFTDTGSGSADVNAPHIITFTSEASGAHSYTLDGSDLSTSAGVESVSTDTNDLLVDGAVYDVKVEYQDTAGNSASTTNTNFTYDTTAPTGLNALSAGTPTQSSVTLTWSAVTEANFSHYEIWYDSTATIDRSASDTEWDDSDDVLLATISTTSTVITGLTGNTTYYFKIWAVDNAGNEETVPETSQLTTDAPISYWKFDDNTGQTAVDTSGSNNGTLGSTAGADAEDPAWTAAQGSKFGASGLSFDGTNDYVDAGNDASLDITDNFSVTAWIKPSSSSFAWTKKVPITISGSPVDLTDYQVMVTVTYDADMVSDFSDLRFVDSAGNILSYWIEEFTASTSADVWVRVPYINSAGTTIYMYYGNASAASASNGTDTFEFFDDFESGNLDKWDVSTGAQITTTSANVHQGTYAVEVFQSVNNFYKLNSYGNSFILEAMLKPTTDGYAWFGTIIGNNYNSSSRLTGISYIPGTFYVYDGGFHATSEPFSGYNKVKIVIAGSTVDYYGNGASLYSGSYSTTVEKIVLYRWSGTTYMVGDNIFIRKYTATEPSAAVGSELSVSNAMGGIVAKDTGYGLTVTDAQVSADAWTYVALTYDGTDRKLYINGALNFSQPQDGASQNSDVLKIGDSVSFPFNGTIDEVKIYNYARSTTQITDDYSGANNTAPTAASVTASQATDGTGRVTISAIFDDADDENTIQGKIEYFDGSSWKDPTLSEVDVDTFATDDDATVENDQAYQLGNHTTASSIKYITTSSGTNTVTFIWESQTDEPSLSVTNAQIRITPYDEEQEGTVAPSADFTLDNVAPAISALSVSPSTGTVKVGDTVTLTITADAAGYTESAITVNSVAVTGFTDAGAGSYTATYTVAETNNDVASGLIAASVVLSDTAGNTNIAFTSVDTNTLIVDANSPTATSLSVTPDGSTAKIGDNITVEFTTSNTDGESATIDLTTIGLTSTETLTWDAVDSFDGTFAVAAGTADSATASFTATVTDDAGNTATSVDTANVDAVTPAVTDDNLSAFVTP